MNNIILITGATAGIGEAIAEKFAEKKYRLVITGRRKERLDKLKEQLEGKYKTEIIALNFDIRNKEAIDKAFGSLPKEWLENIDILVNNAGLAVGLSSIQEGEIDDWERMIDTNIKGLLYVSRAIAPYMVKKEKGHIFNIGSIAGKEVYSNGNVYCGTKHAVDAITKAMRIDMLKHKIKVTGICPGKVETEFSIVRFKGDEEKAKKVYESYQALMANDIAEVVYFAATRPAHVNLNDVVITATDQANSFYQN